MKRSVEINTFIDLFSYDPISTILNLMKYKKNYPNSNIKLYPNKWKKYKKLFFKKNKIK